MYVRGWGECVCERVGEGREGKGRKVYMSVCACVEVGCIVSKVEGERRGKGEAHLDGVDVSLSDNKFLDAEELSEPRPLVDCS